jgi:hypothetical protein
MSLNIRQKLNAPNLRGDTVLPTPGTGIGMDSQVVPTQKVTLKLTDATLAVLEANDYGSLKLCDLPDRNIVIDHVEVDLVLTKEGNTNGIVAATDLDVGVGTAAASATTLATTMINVLEKADIDDNALAVDYEAVTLGQSTATVPNFIADGASNALYLNAVAVGGITADSSLSVTGFVDIYYRDLGNRAS